MSTVEVITLIFGTTLITAIGTIIAFTTNIFNLKDRYTKWEKEKIRDKHKSGLFENNPDYVFTLNYLSNPEPGKCILNATLLNISKESKFIESFSYHFQDRKNPERYEPTFMVMNGEKWPKRLEHGERIHISQEFNSALSNSVFQYWYKGFIVYCSSRSTTRDLLRTNAIDFDKLMEFMEPINENYKELAILLSYKTGGSKRDIHVSLWQLQFFKRLTVHIVKQLQANNIPMVEYLIEKHGLTVNDNFWDQWYRDLEQRKINPPVIEEFLKTLI